MTKILKNKWIIPIITVFVTSSCAHYKRPTYRQYSSSKVTPSSTINAYKAESQKRELDKLIDNGGQLDKPKFLMENKDAVVRMWITYFSTRGKDRFERYLKNGEKYRPLIESIFDDYGLPKELYFVGLIESGYYLKAKSHANAVGPWQFIKATGKRYGLNIRRDVDERQSIVKSTQAAALFFQDLYNIFGSWELALSAYNAGEYGVIRRIRKANSRDFYELSRKKHLPKETRHYVPKVLAAMEVYNNAKKYKIRIPKYKFNIYKNLQEVQLKKSVYLSDISKKSNIKLSTIKKLNPDLKRNATPYIRKGYTLILPKTDKIADFTKLEKVKVVKRSVRPTQKRRIAKTIDFSTYKVKNGDNLYTIARRNHTSISKILKLNNMKRKTIYIGQKLKLPSVDVQTYIVKRGDFLERIAKKHKVSVSELKKINSIKNSKIYPGQKLIVSIN